MNDPGEGSQAKRRASAVIVDHLIPAMSRAEIHGGLAELETLIDEYYLAAGIDERRRRHLEGEILAAAERHGLDRDLGISRGDRGGALRSLDAYLCELKEMQIRDGLHTLGVSPSARKMCAGGDRPGPPFRRAPPTTRSIAPSPDLARLQPTTAISLRPGPAHDLRLAALSDAPWRTSGDTVGASKPCPTLVERHLGISGAAAIAGEAGAGPGAPDFAAAGQVHGRKPSSPGSR